MRTHGKLVKWNDERGFGFIEPSSGTEEVFVHVSAFPCDNVRPRVGEFISFDIDQRADGKKQALRVMRPGTRTPEAKRSDPKPATAVERGQLVTLISVLLVAALGWYAYAWLVADRITPPAPVGQSIAHPTRAPASLGSRCDGRTRCSQMTSCAEATYFIKQCPGTEMDGDGDGVPCESQWCGSSWAH